MRTTCDLKDYLMLRVQEMAVAEKTSIKEVLNTVILAGLEHPITSQAEPWKCLEHDVGTARIDYTKAWNIIDSLEIDAVAEKVSLRK